MNPSAPSDDWAEDCLHWHGEILRGPGAHWCEDWDFLPIDATCSEWSACQCLPPEEKAAAEHALLINSLAEP